MQQVLQAVLVRTVMLSLMLWFSCGPNGINELQPYEPPIVFTGYFNGEYSSLAGNRWWPNSCSLVGDTVRIYCYSTFFGESNHVRHGDLLRLDLYPDTVWKVATRNTLFHLARYYESNESYTVTPMDTLFDRGRVQADIVALSRRLAGDIELEDFIVTASPIPGTTGRRLEIKQGHLYGTVRYP